MTVKFNTTHEMIIMAKRALSQDEWDYINGAAESETSLRRNRLALDCLAFRPRILRDVREDLDRGRVYLPAEELAAFDLGVADLERQVVDARWVAFMRWQIARARDGYARAAEGIGAEALAADVTQAAEVERAVARCLRKDPQRRWQNMADLKVALQDLKEESDSGTLSGTLPAAAKPAKRGRIYAAAALAVGVLAAIGAGAGNSRVGIP